MVYASALVAAAAAVAAVVQGQATYPNLTVSVCLLLFAKIYSFSFLRLESKTNNAYMVIFERTHSFLY